VAKYFIDCEFIESGPHYPIDLISIGIVCEDGRELYLLNYDCDWSRANDWVKENVLSQVPEKPLPMYGLDESYRQGYWNKGAIADKVAQFCGCTKTHKKNPTPEEIKREVIVNYTLKPDTPKPEFWGEWCSYDWVVFCQLFGTMMDLPKGFPMRCRDIIQWAEDHLGVSSDLLPPSLETEGNHNALLGAKTVRNRYLWLQEKQNNLKASN